MKLRPVHLVGLILLLSALRGAEGTVLPAGEYGLDGRYGVVLSQDRAGVWTEVKLSEHKSGWRIGTGGFILPARFIGKPRNTRDTGLPSAALATFRTPWTMRPPAAQCAAVHSATGLTPEPSTESPSL
jgi:hypothetical protein